MKKGSILNISFKNRRAVDTIIATLLMVAVAATGGTAIFGFSQDFFNEQQIAAPAGLEQLEVTGFDATDSITRELHNGNTDATTGIKSTGAGVFVETERIYIYLLNKGSEPVAINTLTFAGITYSHNATTVAAVISSAPSSASNNEAPEIGAFVIIEEDNKTSIDKVPELEAGQEVTIVLALNDAIKVGRDAQLKITTAAGGEFTDIINIGQIDN